MGAVIPPSSPVYPTSYVYVYDTSPTTVSYGYYPGYYGDYYAWGVMAFGTGWYYGSYYYDDVYWPYGYTYGAGAWYNERTGTYGRSVVGYGPYGGAGTSLRAGGTHARRHSRAQTLRAGAPCAAERGLAKCAGRGAATIGLCKTGRWNGHQRQSDGYGYRGKMAFEHGCLSAGGHLDCRLSARPSKRAGSICRKHKLQRILRLGNLPDWTDLSLKPIQATGVPSE